MLLRDMQVLELMKTHVIKTTPEATLSEAADLLDLYQTTGLPVIDADDRLCGMLTEKDILRAVSTFQGKAGAMRVQDWMTAPAVCLSENMEIALAARVMWSKGLKRLPVVTEAGKVVGVLNRIDILQALFEGTIDDAFADGG